MKILVLCTGNTGRSQMAEGFLHSLDPSLDITSAGTKPGTAVNPIAVKVMKEIGIDISKQFPKPVDNFLNDSFDYAITVCDDARKDCPYFTGEVRHRLHIGIDDPSKVRGLEDEVMDKYRKIRDQITREFERFYEQNIKAVTR